MKTWMIAALLPLIWGCDDQGLPPDDTPEPAVSVEFLEASCTEVWLRLAPRNVSPPYTLTLLRNDSAVATISSPPADTTVIDEGLAPSLTYTYRARLTSPSGLNLTGDPLQVRTLDTTSHQFTWETTVLGDGGSSIFYDVAIVNDTLAYAVGEVYLRDSSGVLNPNAYNLAKWDGLRWQLLRIQFYTFCGQSHTGSYPARSIFAFSASDVWIAMDGSQVVRWNGQTQSAPMCTPVSINKLWGENPTSIWAVGNNGGVANFNGSTWRRVESRTGLTLRSVWGMPDGGAVWACGYDVSRPGTVLLRGQGVTWSIAYDGGPSEFTVRQDSLSGTYAGVYAPSRQRIMVASSAGLYLAPGSTRGEARRTSFVSGYFPGFPNGVGGDGGNDVFVVGEYGMIAHFNGMTWRHELALAGDRAWLSVAVRDGRVAAVGYTYSGLARAVVAIGTRSR